MGREQEAELLARRIAQMVRNQETLVYPSDEAPRPVEYQDIAILFRAMTHVDLFEDALKRYGIPYHIVGGRGFYETQEVTDMIALLKAVARENDLFSLWAWLRSPLVGLQDQSILAVAQVAKQFDGDWGRALTQDLLPAGEQAKFNQAMGLPQGTDYQVAGDELPPVDVEERPLPFLFEQALSSRPEIASFESARQASGKALDSARWGWSPTIDFSGSYFKAGPEVSALTDSWAFGFTLSWQLLQGGLTVGRVREAEQNLVSSTAALTGEQLQVRFDVEQAEATLLGNKESVVAAQQCERQAGFHEVAELGFLERVEAGPGLETVVGTSLWNDAMPFIRYRIEDLVEPAPKPLCPCGRGLPLVFARILGRMDDTLQDVDGQGVFAVTVRMVVKPQLDPFENYQVIQSGRDRYEVTLTGSKREEKEARIASALRSVLGGGRADIRIRYGEQLYTSGGKVRNVINLTKGTGRATAAAAG
jgi:hypothetical protein